MHSSNEENSQSQRADLDDNSTTSEPAVTVKSLYNLALHKIPLGGAVEQRKIINFTQCIRTREIV